MPNQSLDSDKSTATTRRLLALEMPAFAVFSLTIVATIIAALLGHPVPWTSPALLILLNENSGVFLNRQVRIWKKLERAYWVFSGVAAAAVALAIIASMIAGEAAPR